MSRCRYLNSRKLSYQNTTIEVRHICDFCSGVKQYKTTTSDGAFVRVMTASMERTKQQ